LVQSVPLDFACQVVLRGAGYEGVELGSGAVEFGVDLCR
jgi:hypothetical protein